jgi:hypothetical protein
MNAVPPPVSAAEMATPININEGTATISQTSSSSSLSSPLGLDRAIERLASTTTTTENNKPSTTGMMIAAEVEEKPLDAVVKGASGGLKGFEGLVLLGGLPLALVSVKTLEKIPISGLWNMVMYPSYLLCMTLLRTRQFQS